MVVLWFVLGAAAVFFAVLAARAAASGARKPRAAAPEPPVPQARQLYYAQGLGRMLRCATVSHKGAYDDAEFARLRQEVAELFPLVHARAEKTTFGQDCWVYRLPGRDSGRRILLMSHHDVAPVAPGEAWSHGPFSGEVAEGAVWGRGAVDTKGPLYAEFQALEELLAEGWQPPCDVYLASSHNEELAGDGIPLAVQWFSQQGLTFDLVLDEGGGVIDPPLPGIRQKCAMIAIHEKGRCAVECEAVEASSHAGLAPRADTPVARMAAFITAVAKRPPFRRRLYPEVRAMFEALCPFMPFALRLVFANLWCFAPLVVRLLPRFGAQPGAMVGTQCSFRRIEGSSAAHCCRAEAFLRPVRKSDLEADLEAFKALARQYGVQVKPGEEYDVHAPSNPGEPALAFVRQCAQAVFPQAASAPFLLPAGSDARHFDGLCPAVLRFAPICLTPQQLGSVHGKDENLGVEALSRAVVFYKHLLRHWA